MKQAKGKKGYSKRKLQEISFYEKPISMQKYCFYFKLLHFGLRNQCLRTT